MDSIIIVCVCVGEKFWEKRSLCIFMIAVVVTESFEESGSDNQISLNEI